MNSNLTTILWSRKCILRRPEVKQGNTITLELYHIPLELLAQGSSVSVVDGATFLLMMSYAYEAGFSKILVIKSKFGAKKNQCGKEIRRWCPL